MAFSEIETKRIEKAMEAFLAKRRPPAELRGQVDLAYRISGQTVEIFEIRPRWDEPSQKLESAVAKATYARTTDRWKIYWQRFNEKWVPYPPSPEVRSLEAALDVIDQDVQGCFFG